MRNLQGEKIDHSKLRICQLEFLIEGEGGGGLSTPILPLQRYLALITLRYYLTVTGPWLMLRCVISRVMVVMTAVARSTLILLGRHDRQSLNWNSPEFSHPMVLHCSRKTRFAYLYSFIRSFYNT